jgi:putative transposase
MARRQRFLCPGVPQHITKRGHNRDRLFLESRDFRKFLQLLLEGSEAASLAIHSYVLMDNHVHLLATPHREGSLARAMQWVSGYYTQWFNVKYRRTGSLWEGRYWAAIVDSESYFLRCSCYIHQNPVRAGLVSESQSYPWSSYSRLAHGSANPLITPHSIYLSLGNTDEDRQLSYRRIVSEGLDDETVFLIRESTRMSKPIGNKAFRDSVREDIESVQSDDAGLTRV